MQRYNLVITPLHGSKARAELFRRNADGRVSLAGSASAVIGKNGVGKTVEGDGKTPSGEINVLRAFGILPNPGTSLEYIDVTPDTVACDVQGPYYNRIVKGVDCQGERMYLMRPEYNYGLQTDYNSENVYPLGSAIFIHCRGEKDYTAGCIAFEEEFMKQLVILAGEGMKITIKDEGHI